MGSPRMEGLDDVFRVTRCVAERDEGLMNLVPDSSGMMVAEIMFPLAMPLDNTIDDLSS